MLAEWRMHIALHGMNCFENISHRRFVVALHAGGGAAFAIQRARPIISGGRRHGGSMRCRTPRPARSECRRCGGDHRCAHQRQNGKSTYAISDRHPLALAQMPAEAAIFASLQNANVWIRTVLSGSTRDDNFGGTRSQFGGLVEYVATVPPCWHANFQIRYGYPLIGPRSCCRVAKTISRIESPRLSTKVTLGIGTDPSKLAIDLDGGNDIRPPVTP